MHTFLRVAFFAAVAAILPPSYVSAQAPGPQYTVIPNQYIVTFRDEVTRDELLPLIRSLTVEHRLRLRHTFKDALRGFSAELPPGVVDQLRQHPAILAVEPNGYWYLDTVDAPTNLTATPSGQTAIVLNWTDNATTEIAFEVVRSTTGIDGDYTRLIATRGVDVTTYTDTQTTVGQEYCYRVRVAEGLTVIGPFSEPACATIEEPPPPTVPAAPSGLSAEAINSQRIDIAWSDESDNESGFRIEQATAGGAFVEIDLTGTDVETYSSTGLEPETEYCFRVRAFNDAGDSDYSNSACATTDPAEPPPPDPLAAPTDLTAEPSGDSAIVLTWTDNATAEIGFEVQRSTSGAGGPYVRIGGVAQPNATTFTDGTVVAGNTYCYRVRAGISLAEVGPFSEPACATAGSPPPEPPAAPTALLATAINDGRIDLAWADNSGNESGFEVERRTGSVGEFQQIDVLGTDATSYSDSGLEAETEYCYRVRAFNSAGDSAYTGVSCATTDAAPPPGACLDTGNHDDLALLWGITRIKADLNATWRATQAQDCEIVPWYFGIDSGLDSDHPDLNVVEIMGFIAADPSDDGEDTNGHGTHTAGTAAAIDGNGGAVGVAPGAPIYGFKVCGTDGTCAIDDIISAVDEVTTRKLANPGQPMVANMSLGGGINAATDTAVRRSVNAGVVYSLSAGNGVLGACLFPANSQGASPARVGDDLINAQDGSDGDLARINGAITVTSSNESDSDNNCNFGNPVTVAAPGNDIFSTWLDGGYNTISGTSMAAPHAAGAAMLYLQRVPDATPTEVEQAIVNELDPWTTNDTPNAGGRLDAETL